eukprot:gene1293-32641_t
MAHGWNGMPPGKRHEAAQAYAEQSGKGKLKSQKALDDIRLKNGFKRIADGRVMLRGENGDWYSLRLDLEIPGVMLLRDPKGMIYALQSGTLRQVDLADDFIITLLFSDGEWEESKLPLLFTDDEGNELGLQMDALDFRQVVGIVKEITAGQEANSASLGYGKLETRGSLQ